MAAYRFSVKPVQRSAGQSAVASAAYRAGAKLYDERAEKQQDYTRRRGVMHSEIMLPKNAPEELADRETLWNTVEHTERRKDAQLAREIQMNLPHELDDETRRELAREFIQQEFVSRGMIADLAIHAADEKGDQRNHHAHIMLTMRALEKEGFGKKERAWNDTGLLERWREKWADHQNRALEKAGFEERVSHLSLEEQGIDREPEPKLGPIATQMEREGRESHAGNDLRAVWARNLERAKSADELARLSLKIEQERTEQIDSQLKAEKGRDPLYDYQRQILEKQHARYEERIRNLSAQLDNRGQFFILWDKLRGRLGWNAEQELQAARTGLHELEERQSALDIIQAQQERDRYAEPADPRLQEEEEKIYERVEPEQREIHDMTVEELADKIRREREAAHAMRGFDTPDQERKRGDREIE